MRQRQAAARRDQTARHGQPFLPRARGSAPAHWHAPSTSCAPAVCSACTAASCAALPRWHFSNFDSHPRTTDKRLKPNHTPSILGYGELLQRQTRLPGVLHHPRSAAGRHAPGPPISKETSRCSKPLAFHPHRHAAWLLATAGAALALPPVAARTTSTRPLQQGSGGQKVAAAQIGLLTTGARPSPRWRHPPPPRSAAPRRYAQTSPFRPWIQRRQLSKNGTVRPRNEMARWSRLIGGGYNGSIPSLYTHAAAPAAQAPTLVKPGAPCSPATRPQAGAPAPRRQLGTNDEAVGQLLRRGAEESQRRGRRARHALLWPQARAALLHRRLHRRARGPGRMQKWPAEWDGVISWYPAWNAASLDRNSVA